MDNNAILRTVSACSKLYKENLLDKAFLFIARSNKTGQYSSLQVCFEKRHFLHLTGLVISDKINATRFFDLCLEGAIKPSHIALYPSGQSRLKLEALPQLMALPWTAKMIGDYREQSGNFLYTEKIAGSVASCMGFVMENGSSLLVPNTALKIDIRDVSHNTKQIMAVYSKGIEEVLYPCTPVTVAKILRRVDKLIWPEEITRLLRPD